MLVIENYGILFLTGILKVMDTMLYTFAQY